MWIRYRIAIRRIQRLTFKDRFSRFFTWLAVGKAWWPVQRHWSRRENDLYFSESCFAWLNHAINWKNLSLRREKIGDLVFPFFIVGVSLKGDVEYYKKRAAQQVLLFKALLLRLLNQVVAPPDLVIRFSLQGCRPVRCALWELFFPLDLYFQRFVFNKRGEREEAFSPLVRRCPQSRTLTRQDIPSFLTKNSLSFIMKWAGIDPCLDFFSSKKMKTFFSWLQTKWDIISLLRAFLGLASITIFLIYLSKKGRSIASIFLPALMSSLREGNKKGRGEPVTWSALRPRAWPA